MTPAVRKVALTAHIISSVGWLGAVAGFEGLAITGLASGDALMVRAAYLAMDRIAWLVIAPFAFASLTTGLTMSLGTKWGLFRHYWVLTKFLINVLAIVLFFLHTRLISFVASAATERTLFDMDLRPQRIQLVAMAGAALLALLVATVVAAFKPPGMTPYGRQKQQHARRKTLNPVPALQIPAVPANETTKSKGDWGIEIFLAAISALILALALLHHLVGGLGSHGH